jgi:hypothetical protein
MRFTFVILLFLSFGADAQMIIKAHPNYRPMVSANLLLDDYPNAAAAYSLRKLDKDYTGSAIRVRRSNDNSEQDIGFTSSGDLDTAALKSFCSTNSGFVTTWYDQSGNGRNSIQATASAQPRIVNAGTIERKSGKVGIIFDGSNDFLDGTDITITLGNITAFSVFAANSTAGTQFIYNVNTDPRRFYIPVITGGRFYLGYDGSSTAINVAAANTNLNVFSGMANTTNAFARLNGTNSTTIARSPAAAFSALNRIGTYASGNSHFNGYISECILYTTYQSAYADIETNINSYYGIY